MIDRDDPFLDLGYTSPEVAEKLRAARLAKTAGSVVRRTTKRPSTRRGRPPVGEDGILLNVDTEPTALDPAQAEHQVATVWSDMEGDALAGLEARLDEAVTNGDGYQKALARKAIDDRQKRWDSMNRPPVQLMMPGMNRANIKHPTGSSDVSAE